MAKINQELLSRLESKLRISRRQVYTRIDEMARETFLPKNLAALRLAAGNGISIARYAGEQELAELRNASSSAAPVESVRLPRLSAANRNGKNKTAARKLTKAKKPAKQSPRRGTSVFVVHGRDEALRRAMFRFLRCVGINPIEWKEAIKLTGKPSPYVGEILDAAFREAVAIVVLLSPDDQAKLKKKFVKSHEPAYEKSLTGQARPNVLFEAGMAIGRNSDSTVLVQVGDCRPFSDIAGRHVVHLSNSTQSRSELITKLANAGCNVDTEGTDWHTEGDFSPS